MAGNLPPGCTQRECDEAQPGYWDSPEQELEALERCPDCGALVNPMLFPCFEKTCPWPDAR